MSTEVSRPIRIAPASNAIFPMWTLADLGRRIGDVLRGRSLRASGSWSETASDRLLRDIGLDRDQIRSAMSYLDEAQAKARSSLLL